MGYARLGTGPKTLLWLGGPSVGAPRGPYLALMTFMLRPFVAVGYSVCIVSQRPNMAVGYTVADMAEDYAQVIAGEFGGRADLMIGDSTGGMIGFCLAARHADRFGHIVIAPGRARLRAAAPTRSGLARRSRRLADGRQS